ncbi:DUF5082 family protein [Bacillus carboniphilus]|uniref:DUF5082 family protein n=1 Tax=Bacillus carboniphilus TaxID=86663 RepID=A0ABY9JPR4_9BACI|nr:DUF5082 family protein [Bacillus carboniphilus]WLR41392.1 DUF5082 family protein [Bacillus carboniphilus]
MSYLSYLQSELSEKQQHLIRLKKTVTQLEQIQNEFRYNQKLIDAPDLSSQTWKGNLANQFLNIRDELVDSYNQLSQTDLNHAIDDIENKIADIKRNIHSLEIKIDRERERIEMERRKERSN